MSFKLEIQRVERKNAGDSRESPTAEGAAASSPSQEPAIIATSASWNEAAAAPYLEAAEGSKHFNKQVRVPCAEHSCTLHFTSQHTKAQHNAKAFSSTGLGSDKERHTCLEVELFSQSSAALNPSTQSHCAVLCGAVLYSRRRTSAVGSWRWRASSWSARSCCCARASC